MPETKPATRTHFIAADPTEEELERLAGISGGSNSRSSSKDRGSL